ncbi:FUSC family protein [Modestobacter roseus]|uniref:Putative membrane protein YccC n=1 Tax=Modestobacter roseus TaxID=1181884 RepID=A0A562IND2_9ACTN|nr:FUSC family protein [Modestobacter roseus]MQA32498.1 FUSC family protein [Modestobacter roseus]TWH72235.1 putative membrane protein YccC [Modestobacter roseus]
MADRGLRAPAWLEELVHTNRPSVPWRDVVRFGLVVPAPLAVALALGGTTGGALGGGVFGTMGALAATLAPQQGPLRIRLRRVAAASLLGGLGLVVGHALTGGGWAPVLLLATVSALAALISAVSAPLSLGALQLLVYTAISSGLQTPLPLAGEVGWFLAGAALGTLAVLLQARTEHDDPDRAAVGAVFTRVAELLEAVGTEGAEEARRALTLALNTGYDRVIHARSRAAGRSAELGELAGVLNSAAPLVEAAVASARTGVAADSRDIGAARALATAVTERRPLAGERPPPVEDGPSQRRAVRHGIRLAWNVVGDPEERASAAVPRPQVDRRARARDLVDRTVGDADSRSFVVRLTLCMTVAEIARQTLPVERPYWVLLTVAIVLKPDYGSVFTRAVHRGAGTLLGVLIGSLLLMVVSRDAWILLPLAVSAAALPWARSGSFGLFSVFQTPLIILLLDLATPAGAGLVGARLVDTLIGCAIVLVFGYLLWPQTWRAPLDDALRAAILALERFVDAAFTGSPEATRRARRASYRALAELQTQLQRRLAEPPPVSTRAAAWYPVIVQLERTSDAVTEAVIELRAGEPVPETGQVAVLCKAIRELEQDLRAHRLPDDAEVHAEGVLALVAREVDAARRLVRETTPGRWAGVRGDDD